MAASIVAPVASPSSTRITTPPLHFRRRPASAIIALPALHFLRLLRRDRRDRRGRMRHRAQHIFV